MGFFPLEARAENPDSRPVIAFPVRWIPVLATAALWLAVVPASGQIEALKNAIAPPTPQDGGQEAESDEDRLATWVEEAREKLATLRADGFEPPAGVTSSEVEGTRDDLEGIVRVGGNPGKLTESAAQARAAREKAQEAGAAWSGFEDGPPESMLVLDKLVGERDAAADSLVSQQTALEHYNSLLAGLIAETEHERDKARELLVALREAADAEKPLARWRFESTRAAARRFALRVREFQSDIEAIHERIAATEADIALLDRKIKVASTSATLREADIRTVEAEVAERKAELGAKLDAVTRRLAEADTARDAAAKRSDRLASSDPGGSGQDQARRLQIVLDHLVAELNELEDSYEAMIRFEEHWVEAYRHRLAAITAEDPADREEAIARLRKYRDRLRALERVLVDAIAELTTEVAKTDSHATGAGSEDSAARSTVELRSVLAERLELLRGFSVTTEERSRMIDHWIHRIAPEEDKKNVGSYVVAAARGLWNGVDDVWSFEITSFDKEVVVDGLRSSEKVAVTLGMLIRATVFFAIGYWICARLADRIQNILIVHKKLEEAYARTLRNWTMIGVSVLLSFATLALLRIPLTVFAVVGGALAIGIGFGTQTLIKNFISGLIVLGERKVRVGDLLDVDGIIGRVVEVNARSSVLRGFDGVETMIPNSVFLESRFTNWTLTNPKRRREIRVGVSYGTQPKKVIQAIEEEAGRHGLVCKDPEPCVVFEDFGDSSLNFCLYYWYDYSSGGGGLQVDSDLRVMIEKRLAEMGVTIPFPQRDVHFSSEAPLEVRIAKDEP